MIRICVKNLFDIVSVHFSKLWQLKVKVSYLTWVVDESPKVYFQSSPSVLRNTAAWVCWWCLCQHGRRETDWSPNYGLFKGVWRGQSPESVTTFSYTSLNIMANGYHLPRMSARAWGSLWRLIEERQTGGYRHSSLEEHSELLWKAIRQMP